MNPIGPRGVYDEAKRYAEALTMAYHRQQGVDTAIVRIFNTYGPRMRPHDGRAIPTFLRQALQDRGRSRCSATASQTRSFCFVSDLIRGIIALAESGYHLPVNVGNPDEYTLLQLAEAVIEVTGSRSEIVFEALPTDDPQVRQPDTTPCPADPRLGAGGRACATGCAARSTRRASTPLVGTRPALSRARQLRLSLRRCSELDQCPKRQPDRRATEARGGDGEIPYVRMPTYAPSGFDMRAQAAARAVVPAAHGHGAAHGPRA